ncbi:serine/threonine-protein kinase SBK1-like [Leucoraja erinacea]|uniref:serine/threonine-protein kinase SBK1-like n=1 Tax=Leucoraja erinaceus TaxID=7782 RepID=UPI0024560288|nr:serine/threonine-protein kinase SBK1-like [Leucoraja erinacea]
MDGGDSLGPEIFIEEMMLLMGQTLAKMEIDDHYQVIRQIGAGTFGTVQLVRHRQQGTLMALKLMEKGRTEVRGFLREYSTGLFLSPHPFITSAFGIAFESSEHYAFMQEFAPMGDLFDLIQPLVGIPQAAAKRCGLQLSLALDHLHQRGLVHRDVKPDNVLLFDRECRHVKLSDFGLVRREGLRLRPGSDQGPYAPPEIVPGVRGARVARPEDAWAFGVLIYVLLTGNFPWERATDLDPRFQAFKAWRNRPEGLQPPPEWAGVAPGACRMLKGLLAFDPKERAPVKVVRDHIRERWAVGACTEGPISG